jgi:hypothetical protein
VNAHAAGSFASAAAEWRSMRRLVAQDQAPEGWWAASVNMKGLSNVIPADAGIQTAQRARRWPSLDARIRGHDKVRLVLDCVDPYQVG